MGSRFVVVPASAIRVALAKAGFELLPGGGEEVYARRHHKDRSYEVKVYTSLARGAGEARNCGADAIRVVAVKYLDEKRAVGIWKGKRVFRTGSVDAVLERMIERAREAYGFINDELRQKRYNMPGPREVKHCNHPTYARIDAPR